MDHRLFYALICRKMSDNSPAITVQCESEPTDAYRRQNAESRSIINNHQNPLIDIIVVITDESIPIWKFKKIEFFNILHAVWHIIITKQRHHNPKTHAPAWDTRNILTSLPVLTSISIHVSTRDTANPYLTYLCLESKSRHHLQIFIRDSAQLKHFIQLFYQKSKHP